MSSHTKENYLKLMFHLTVSQQGISVTELGKRLNVSKPTVNNMIKRLERDGYVTYQRYRPILLTDNGLKEAKRIVRRHRLAEMFLVDVMGFGWDEVHDIAEEMEHITSEVFFDRMDAMLDYPTFDPHGSPIPDKMGKITMPNLVSLIQVVPDKPVVLRGLKETSAALMSFLNHHGIKLGDQIVVKQRWDVDQLTQVVLEENELTLTDDISRQLLVAEL